jgi:hypothetical protein|tara:strand:+ start:249 stop:416 length:168 start_codon:yes stop_codon:yes gene_type:complete
VEAVEALELIVDLIENKSVYCGDYETATSMLAEIETLAISYDIMEVVETRKELGL